MGPTARGGVGLRLVRPRGAGSAGGAGSPLWGPRGCYRGCAGGGRARAARAVLPLPSPGRAQAAERRPHGALVHPREALPGLVRHAERGPELVRARGSAGMTPTARPWGLHGHGTPGSEHGPCAVLVHGFSPCQFAVQQPVISASTFCELSVQNQVGLLKMSVLDAYLENLFASVVTTM